MTGFRASSPRSVGRALALRLHVDERRLAAVRRSGALLLERGAPRLVEPVEPHRPPLVDAAVDRADDAHVGQPLLARRLGVAPLQDAVGEVGDLDANLVARLELLLLRLLVAD